MEQAAQKPAHKSGWLNLLVDYGPVVVFFLVYRHFTPADRNDSIAEVLAVIKGTVGFMVAAVAALVVSRWKLGRISPMLWLSTLLILGFGAITIVFQNPVWIQIKPTVVYLIFAAALLGGVLRGKALLRYLLEAAFEGLDERGWMILSRNWGIYFLFLAALNEVLRQIFNVAHGNFGTWIALKLWLFLPLSFLFTFVHVPMLLRHGLGKEDEEEVLTELPHE